VAIDLFPEEQSTVEAERDFVDGRDLDRLRKKERKRLFDSSRPLDAWECYRALNDATDEAYELIDISNREARFALILMGALNAGVAILLTRADAFAALTTGEGYFVAALFVGYVIMALVFLLQAIEALRPGHFRPHLDDWPKTEDRPAGVRYHEDVITRTPAEHWQAWQEVRLSQLNAELAVQVHSLSLKNNAKHIALRRLYRGLRAMALVLAILMVVFVWLVWT
jgi:hypothetical protein